MIIETTRMNASRAFSHCETQGICFPALENQVPHWFVSLPSMHSRALRTKFTGGIHECLDKFLGATVEPK